MTSDEITEAVVQHAERYGVAKTPEYRKLHANVCSSPKKERYFGLMGVFKRDLKTDKLRAQTLAGRMLQKITPRPMESCEASIFRLLENWDVSAEEVIFYLRQQHGTENVLCAIDTIREGQLTELDIATLESMKFWCGK
ncbi:hypothetical protein [Corallincola spongiicola]|uniref:Uncharacterized protein n=1 Tax=Corallincola spongiicola TaxID=2520508 RepID=A0ABY1WTQ0_9GAMM|nr:hypothetical protein [Corallincola spongiicola]TAA48115.1 hypothetical protein EXY25_02420 [Corallincola spongiicola]